MRGVARHHRGLIGHLVRHFVQILEVHRAHRLADPVNRPIGRDRPTHIGKRLVQVGGDGVRTVLVADDADDRDLACRRHPALTVVLAQERVHPFQHPLRH